MAINEDALKQMLTINSHICGDDSALKLSILIRDMNAVSKKTIIHCIEEYFDVIYKLNFSKFQDNYYVESKKRKYDRKRQFSFLNTIHFQYCGNFIFSYGNELDFEELWIDICKLIISVIKNSDNLDIETLILSYQLSLMFYNYYENEVNKNLYFDYKNGLQSLYYELKYMLIKDKFRFIDDDTGALRCNINSNILIIKNKLKKGHNL